VSTFAGREGVQTLRNTRWLARLGNDLHGLDLGSGLSSARTFEALLDLLHGAA